VWLRPARDYLMSAGIGVVVCAEEWCLERLSWGEALTDWGCDRWGLVLGYVARALPGSSCVCAIEELSDVEEVGRDG
jgi:hypothetical protein